MAVIPENGAILCGMKPSAGYLTLFEFRGHQITRPLTRITTHQQGGDADYHFPYRGSSFLAVEDSVTSDAVSAWFEKKSVSFYPSVHLSRCTDSHSDFFCLRF